MELNCPSLDYVYSMTWAEFQLRAYAYNRMQDKEDLKFREVAWSSLIGSHANPKKLPKSKDKFWKIGKSKPQTISDNMKEAIKRAQQEYFKKKRELDGTR